MTYVLMLLSNLFFAIATHSTRPVVSIFAHSEGASPLIIGVMVAAYAFCPMLLALSIGKWLDRYGARIVVMVGASGMAFAILLPILFPNLISLFISQLFFGVSQISVLVSYQKTLGNFPGSRDKNIMWLTLTVAFAEFLGPLIGGFSFEYLGFGWSYGIAGLSILAAMIIGLNLNESTWKSRASSKQGATRSFIDSLGLLKQTNLRKAIIIGALALYSKDLFVAYFPVYGSSIGLSASQIGMVLSTAAAVAVIIRFSQYILVKTFGQVKVIFTMLILSGLSFAMIPLFSGISALFILAGLMGMGLGLCQPISVVFALNFSSTERHGEVLGMRLTFNRGLQFVAPLLFGAVGGIYSVFIIFIANGFLLIGGAFGTRIKEEHTNLMDEQEINRKK